MLVHCNSKFKPYITWFLFPNSGFYNRSIEFGYCPHCCKDIACIVEYRKSDGFKFCKYIKQRDVNKIREQYKHEVEYKSTDLINPKGNPYGWVFGVNKESTDKKTGEVTVTQEACDFYGNKEVVKKYRQTEHSC